jgi:ligand-binding sensor domain-containing protein/signal transduction histidine kinase
VLSPYAARGDARPTYYHFNRLAKRSPPTVIYNNQKFASARFEVTCPENVITSYPRLGWAVCLALTLAFNLSAQEYNVRNWHMEEGLPDGEITAIAQTPEGYLWIGTPKGLARFDGTRFRVYQPKNTPEFKDVSIANLLTDHAGRLWIGTADGAMLRWSAGQFEYLSNPTASLPATAREQAVMGWRTEGNWHLTEDSHRRVWWLHKGVALVQFDEKSVKTYATNFNGLDVKDIEKLGRDSAGNIWAAANSRLRQFSNGHWDSEAQSIPMSWPEHEDEIVLQPAQDGGLLLAEPLRGSWKNYGGQIRRIKDGSWTGRFEPTPFEPGSTRSIVTTLLQDRTGRKWIGTKSGGVHFSDAEGPWRRVQASPSLSEGYVSCIMQDFQDNIWVGTVGDGLYRVARQPISVISPQTQAQRPAIVQSTCLAHDGSVWIGTEGNGLYHYQNNQSINFGTPLNPSDLFISAVFVDRDTNLWLGTKSGLLKLENDRFTPVYGPEELSHPVSSIFEDRRGRLWLGTATELICKIGDQFSIHHLRSDFGAPDVRSITEDLAHNIWIGTLGQGLFVLPRGKAENVRRVDEFPALSARAMTCDPDGTLWIGSWGDGIFRFRKSKFTEFSSEDGLPRDKILCIVPDNAGVLWMSSDNGIFGIKRQALESYKRGASPPLLCQRLSLAQGLANRACSGQGQPVVTRTMDGRLWFPNMEGVAVLDPQLAAGLRGNPNVIIESVLADGTDLSRPSPEEIRAPSSIRRFEFSFASPDLSQTKDVRFRHKLEGMDENWREASADRVAQYSQLPPGPYTFRVMVGGSDGQWHESSQTIAFRVVPRFWELRWVQVLASALVVGAIGASLAWNQRRKLRLRLERMELQQSLEQERRRIARDLHDELGARLTSIALQGELAMRGETIPAAAKAELGSLSVRVRQLINATDEVIWTTDPGNDSLPNLVEFLCDYIERFLTPAGIYYRLDVPSDLPAIPIQSQARHHFLLAVKETLNNAVRHSNAKMLMVQLKLEGDVMTFVISDNGIGFDVQHARPGGNGLVNIQNRMASVSGRAEIASAPGKGTTTTLTMPLHGISRNGRDKDHIESSSLH